MQRKPYFSPDLNQTPVLSSPDKNLKPIIKARNSATGHLLVAIALFARCLMVSASMTPRHPYQRSIVHKRPAP